MVLGAKYDEASKSKGLELNQTEWFECYSLSHSVMWNLIVYLNMFWKCEIYMKKERVAEITGTFSIAWYAANEKGYAQGVEEDNNIMEVRNESNKNRKEWK